MLKSFSQFTATVWLVIIATMANRFTFFMVWPYLAVILYENHGLNAAQIGLFLTIPLIVGNTIGFYVGYLSDLFGRKKITVGALVIAIFALTNLGLTENLWIILGAMVLQSISRSGIEPSGKALITDVLEDRDAKDLALHARYYALNVGASFGPLAGVYWGITGKQTTFLMVAGTMTLYLVAALIVFSREHIVERQEGAEPFSFRSVIRTLSADHSFLVLVFAMFLGGISYSQLEAGVIQFLQIAGHPDVVAFYPIITLTNGLTVLVLQFPLLSATRRFHPMTRSMIGAGLMAVSFSMLASVSATSETAILVSIFVLSVGEVILFPTVQILIDRMAPDGMKGSYFGAAALAGFGFALGPLIGWTLLKLGGGQLLWWSMAAAAAFVAVLYPISGRMRRGADPR